MRQIKMLGEVNATSFSVGAKKVIDTDGKVDYMNLKNVPGSYEPAVHNHDDLYYRKVTTDNHLNDKSNPHGVTKSQVGLGSVDNIQQATKTEFNTHVADGVKHVTAIERAAWNAKAEGTHTHPISQVSGLQTALDAKETPAGAQTKATKALDDAKVYADTKVAGLVNGSPAALDTLQELAKALGDDPNFATTVATQIGTKVDKVAGKQLSTEDYTNAEKTKLAGIAPLANNYSHPANHPPSIITQDTNNRFVTDAEKAVWNSKAAGTHTHAIGQVTNLQTTLDAKETPAGAQAKVDTHAGDNVKHITAAERTAWNAKAAGSHEHAWGEITDKPAAFAPSTHTHPISQVTNLQTTLDAKETPAGAQAKATAAETNAKNASVSKTGDRMTGELKLEDKLTFKSKFSIEYNSTENSLDFIFV